MIDESDRNAPALASSSVLDRRGFLVTLAGAGLAGLGLSACRGAANTPPARASLNRIGVQLYTVRDQMQRDLPATLRAVADTGYQEVETAGFFNLTPQQFRQALDRVGLVSPSGHYPINALRENLDGTLSAAEALGQRWVVVPWLEERERNVAGYSAVAADLNRFAQTARARGIRLAYHNHDFEFHPLEGGRTGFDLLVEGTDPDLVDIELDLFWASKEHQDPVTLFERHPGRYPLWHVKDMEDPRGAQRMVSVGEGDLDFARIFANAERPGLRHFFVEHDNPQDSLASILTGYQNLRQLSY
jgi:sugar phosphate isomerase/epimerase